VAIRIRKWATFREEILFDGERELEQPDHRGEHAFAHQTMQAQMLVDHFAHPRQRLGE